MSIYIAHYHTVPLMRSRCTEYCWNRLTLPRGRRWRKPATERV